MDRPQVQSSESIMEDPQVDHFLLRFLTLPKHTRRAVYLSLLDHLQLDELRELKDRLGHCIFYRDILGSLPLELSALVTAYLDVSDLFNLQAVCKRWKSLLSTRLVRDSVMVWRYGRDVVDTVSPQAFAHFARRRVRLERGQPVSQSHFSWQLPLYEIQMNPMDYCDGRYAWVEMDTFVFVRHLQTGHLMRFCTENRDIFDLVRITDCIVAAFSRRGTCHVWSLTTTASGIFHLPSANFDKFVANGSKIAFSFRGTILQWDLTTQATHAITVPLGLHLIILHPTHDQVATVHIAHADNGRFMGSIPTDRAQFTLLRFSRNADCVGPFLQRSSESVPLPSSVGPGGAFYEDLTDRKARCNHRIGSVHISWHGNRNCTEALVLTADPVSARVYMHRTLPGSIHHCGLSVAAIAPDLLYYIRKVDDNRPALFISNPLSLHLNHDGGCEHEHGHGHRPSKAMSRDMAERGLSWTDFDRRFMLLGDGHSVLLVDRAGMRVWSFDGEAQALGGFPVC